MQSFRQYKRFEDIARQHACQLQRKADNETTCDLDTDRENLVMDHNQPGDLDAEKVLAKDDAIEESNGKLIVRPSGVDVHTDAHNWPLSYRFWTTCILFVMVFALGWVSSCDSDVLGPAAAQFHVSETAETLATALFMIGLASGSLVGGPLSESVGRNAVYLGSMVAFLCFTLGSAIAPNFGAQLAFRFLSGVFSSPTLSMYGGSLADLWTPEERGVVWPVFALSPVLGK